MLGQTDFMNTSNLIVGNAIANIVRHSRFSMEQVMGVLASISKYGNPYHLTAKQQQIYQELKMQIDTIIQNM